MELSPAWGATNCVATQEFLSILRNYSCYMPCSSHPKISTRQKQKKKSEISVYEYATLMPLNSFWFADRKNRRDVSEGRPSSVSAVQYSPQVWSLLVRTSL
jgi:hypothetical protein